MSRILKFCSVVTLLALLEACAVVGSGDLHDLKLVSIERTNLKDHPEIEWLGEEPRPSKPLVAVNFSTGTNLDQLVRDYEYNIFGLASACNNGRFDKTETLQIERYIYDYFGRVTSKKVRESSSSYVSFTYTFYINARSVSLAGDPNAFQYDLMNGHQDICVEIHGGNMLGRSFESNTLVIRRDELAKAFEAASIDSP